MVSVFTAFREHRTHLGVEPHLWCNTGGNRSILSSQGAKSFWSMIFLFCLAVVGRLMLYRRGRPTSVVLLLLMVVPKFSLPLSGHSPLGLHHLFRLVRAARGLVSLGGVEVLQVGAGVRAARIAEVGHGVRAGTGAGGRASVYGPRSVGRARSISARPVPGILTEGWVHSGGAGIRKGLTTAPRTSKHLSALDEVVDGAFDLWTHHSQHFPCPV